MSLIKCNECGKEISNQASVCPNCGCPISGTMPNIPNKAKPKKKNLIPIIIIVIILCGVIKGITTGLPKSSDTKESSNSENSTTVAGETTSKEVATEEYLKINDEGKIGDWTIVITNVEITDKIMQGNYANFSPDEGNKYLKIDCTITNNGTSSHTFLSSFSLKNDLSAKILYQSSYEYSSVNLLGYSEELHDSTLNPLVSKSGSITFKIPDSVAASTDELILCLEEGKKTLKFKVR